MRKCIRCDEVMIENLEINTSNGSYHLVLKEKGIFKGILGSVKASVCPKCGYVETYLDNLDRIIDLEQKI